MIVGNCEGIPCVYRNGAFTYISGANSIYPQAINNDGVIVGWHAVLTPVESSFTLVGDKALIIPSRPRLHRHPSVWHCNSNVMVGIALPISASAQEAFIEQGGTFAFCRYPDTAPGVGTVFFGINKSGIVAGYLNPSNVYAAPSLGFVFQKGIFTVLQPPFNATSYGAFAINDSGVIVAIYRDASNSTFGYIATPQN